MHHTNESSIQCLIYPMLYFLFAFKFMVKRGNFFKLSLFFLIFRVAVLGELLMKDVIWYEQRYRISGVLRNTKLVVLLDCK